MNLHTLILKQGSLYDLIFVGKNKEYGAYYNRQVYPEHLKKALLIYFSFIFIVSFSLWGYSRYMSLNTTKEQKVYKKETVIERYIETKKIDPPVKQELPAETKVKNTITYAVPQIVDIPEDVTPIETVKNLLNTTAEISTVTNKTDETPSPIQLDKPSNPVGSNTTASGESQKPEILEFAQVSPEFPGGEAKLIEYLTDNIRYPNFARINEIEGIVNVEFVVNEDGSISNIKVLSGIKGGCDEEAVRVIKNMPKWSPGLQAGHPVKVYFNVPINFQLSNDDI